MLEAPAIGADHLAWVDTVHQALHAETPLTLVIDDVQNVASSWVDLVLSGRADTARRMAAAVPDGVRSAAELHLAGAWVATQQGALDVAGAELAEARRVSDRLERAAAARFGVRAAVIEAVESLGLGLSTVRALGED